MCFVKTEYRRRWFGCHRSLNRDVHPESTYRIISRAVLYEKCLHGKVMPMMQLIMRRLYRGYKVEVYSFLSGFTAFDVSTSDLKPYILYT